MSVLKFNFKDATKVRKYDTLPNEVKRAIRVISINHDNIILFGSFIYKSQLYPADIDLTESDVHCCDRDENVKYFVSKLQEVVKRIICSDDDYYLGDIKAGLDELYKINIGELKYSKLGVPRLIGYDAKRIRGRLQELHILGYLTDDEVNELYNLANDNITQGQFETLYAKLREKWLLRWTGDEILKGVKLLSNHRKKKLSDAIQEDTLTKIDMWHNILGKFLEITDVYSFYSRNQNGKMETLNFANKPSNLTKQLREEIQKYAFSKNDFKPFKMVKRMWSLARIEGDESIVQILTPFMQSDIGRLNQISSEIETIISILETVKDPPIEEILTQIDGFKWRFNNIYNTKWNEEATDKAIDRILLSNDTNFMISELKQIQDYLKHLVKDETLLFLKSNKLYPPPSKYLP
jgi:hypothetical protein